VVRYIVYIIYIVRDCGRSMQ